MAKPKIHFVVYGVGAIGGTYGTMLATAVDQQLIDTRLSFIARGKTLEALQARGIFLTHIFNNQGDIQERNFETKVQVYEKPENITCMQDEYTIVLLCVKSKDTKTCAQALACWLPADSCVISVQNGIENETILAEILGSQRVIASLTNIAAEVREPGRYVYKGRYSWILGELEVNKGLKLYGKKRIDLINQVFNQAGIKTTVSDSIMTKLWFKLTWNAAFNPSSVFYEATIGKLLANPEAKESIFNIMQEVMQVANAEGHPLPEDTHIKHMQKTSVKEWEDFRTSMLQDYQNSKPIELDELLGVVVKLGAKHGIEVPSSKLLYNNLKDKLAVNV